MHKYKLFSGEILFLKELPLSDYKALLKASYGDEVVSDNFIEVVIALLEKNSQKDKDFFYNLNLCDLLNVLIELRANSMGNVASIVVPKDQKQIRVDIRLDWIQEDIKHCLAFCEEQFVEFDGIKLYFGIPSLTKLNSFLSDEEQFLCFLDKARVEKMSDTAFQINTTEEAKKMLNMLSAKNGKKIIDKFQDVAFYFQQQNFLNRYKIETEEKLRFLPNISSLLWFVKMMFNEPLDSLYHNIFMLAKYGNINPGYLEQCTPGEYIYFVKKLEESLVAEGNEPGPPTPTNETA